ncbi:hypothetical protein H5P28_09175 [Ruficoccus amylovorans]|uniref:Uncharacterized protein n=1 Tax=Ruficoccus amylovorans TaxID=1804625 RepID=A0A842HFS7_9BACT|nr:hypothetical protein [Ruficoccus amylovorans]
MIHRNHTTTVTSHNDAHPQPEFIRLPQPGARCPYTGLSRSTLNELILPSGVNQHKPPVKSVVQKKRNAIRGIRLIHYASLIDYLNGLATKAAQSYESSARPN